MENVKIIGIDLSGPRNVADTCVVVFEPQGNDICFRQAIDAADDRRIYDLVSGIGNEDSAVIGIDAPLSYNPGGGDRPSDRELRRLALEKGRVGVMPPTLIRMVYLTLRGVALTRMLQRLQPRGELKIVEIHPGASMLLRGAPAQDVATFKRDVPARLRLLAWLEGMRLEELPREEAVSDHCVAACAAAMAAWQWSAGKAEWCYAARPPEHPYDFAC
jgi:predicted nuclease with RNAse H fold